MSEYLFDNRSVSGAEVDEYLQAIDDDGIPFLPVMVTAWGRRPPV